ncbi:hypothetical protein [Streptomyces sp. NPDC005017]|uniref:hypothetical protein n=1 Tax=Streptomyces sp. NPDC005017 TaxID=3364706 RepID=UPI0036B5A2FA
MPPTLAYNAQGSAPGTGHVRRRQVVPARQQLRRLLAQLPGRGPTDAERALDVHQRDDIDRARTPPAATIMRAT